MVNIRAVDNRISAIPDCGGLLTGLSVQLDAMSASNFFEPSLTTHTGSLIFPIVKVQHLHKVRRVSGVQRPKGCKPNAQLAMPPMA